MSVFYPLSQFSQLTGDMKKSDMLLGRSLKARLTILSTIRTHFVIWLFDEFPECPSIALCRGLVYEMEMSYYPGSIHRC